MFLLPFGGRERFLGYLFSGPIGQHYCTDKLDSPPVSLLLLFVGDKEDFLGDLLPRSALLTVSAMS